MSRLQELPPDQSAALSLLLRSSRSHDQVAQMLGIDSSAVHDRAHAALTVLAPRLARRIDADTRERIGEYLLGQLAPAQGDAVREQLARSAPAREWAAAIAGELSGLAAGRLPEIPEPQASPREAQRRRPSTAAPPGATRQAEQPAEPAHREGREAGDAAQGAPQLLEHVSRRGGALMLTGILAVAIAVVVLLLTSGGGTSGNAGTLASNRSATAASEGGTGGNGATGGNAATGETGGTQAGSAGKAGAGSGAGASGPAAGSGAEPKVEGQSILTAPNPGSPAKGVLLLASENGVRGLLLSAEHLPPTEGFTYTLWLISAQSSVKPLAFEAPAVKSSGKSKEALLAGGQLPQDASAYDRVELTRETAKHPARPSSAVVLSGEFKAG